MAGEEVVKVEAAALVVLGILTVGLVGVLWSALIVGKRADEEMEHHQANRDTDEPDGV